MVKEGYQKTSDTIRARHAAIRALIALHRDEYVKLYESEKNKSYSSPPKNEDRPMAGDGQTVSVTNSAPTTPA